MDRDDDAHTLTSANGGIPGLLMVRMLLIPAIIHHIPLLSRLLSQVWLPPVSLFCKATSEDREIILSGLPGGKAERIRWEFQSYVVHRAMLGRTAYSQWTFFRICFSLR